MNTPSPKQYELVVNCDNKPNTKQIFSLIYGKNIIGTNLKCTTKVNLKHMKPLHFEILVYRSGKLAIVPLTKGIWYSSPSSQKLVQLESNQCQELEVNDKFKVDKIYTFCVNEHSQKEQISKFKQKNSLSLSNITSQSMNINQKRRMIERSSFFEDSDIFVESSRTQKIKKCINEVTLTKQKATIKQINKQGIKKTEKYKGSKEDKYILEKKGTVLLRSQIKTQGNMRVMLSNCSLSEIEIRSMKMLGAVFADSLDKSFDVLVMDGFCRRTKLLVALNIKAPVVNKDWLLDCIDDGELITDFKQYLLEVSTSDRIKFGSLNLDEVQSRIQIQKDIFLFQDIAFLMQEKNSIPNQIDLKQIIQSGQGAVFTSIENSIEKIYKHIYQIVTKEELGEQRRLKVKGIQFVDPEFILLSSLKQIPQRQFVYN